MKFRNNKTEDLINNKIIIEEKGYECHFIIHEYDDKIVFSEVKGQKEYDKVWKKLINDSKNENYIGHYVPFSYKVLSVSKKNIKIEDIFETLKDLEIRSKEKEQISLNRKLHNLFTYKKIEKAIDYAKKKARKEERIHNRLLQEGNKEYEDKLRSLTF